VRKVCRFETGLACVCPPGLLMPTGCRCHHPEVAAGSIVVIGLAIEEETCRVCMVAGAAHICLNNTHRLLPSIGRMNLSCHMRR
jgi:hypothetical protein